MEAKDTLLSPEQRLVLAKDLQIISLSNKNDDIFEALTSYLLSQAEISFPLGRQEGRKEVVEWLQEYAIHGGEIPLKSVLEDIETHSPFMMSQVKSGG